jgi:hypothetical protein
VERKIRDMKFSAILHGADPKELDQKEYPGRDPEGYKSNLLFGDPADYANMSEQERKALSDKMMTKFTKWAGVK